MHCVAPFRAVLIEVAARRLAEAHRLGGGERALHLGRLLALQRIDAIEQRQSSRAGPLARILQTNGVDRPEPKPAFAAAALVAQQPTGVVRVDGLEVEPVPVAVPPGPRECLDYTLRRQFHVRFRLTLNRPVWRTSISKDRGGP